MKHGAMRIWSIVAVIVALVGTGFGSTTVTGHFKDAAGNAVAGSASTYAKFTLMYCGANQPKVSGTAIVAGSEYQAKPDASGVISVTLYGNDVITCGSTLGNTRWSVVYYVNNRPGPACQYNITGGGPFNLDSQLCSNTVPVVTAPTGDDTYLRRDAGNSPVTGPVTFNGSNTYNGNDTHTGSDTFSGSTTMSGGGSLSGTWAGGPTWTGNHTFSGTNTHSGSETFSGGGSLSGTWAGNPTWSGNHAFSGTNSHTGSETFSNIALGSTSTAGQYLYLMSTFPGSDNPLGLQLAVSSDGLNFRYIQGNQERSTNGSTVLYVPGAGTFRDPSIFYSTANSAWYVAFTDGCSICGGSATTHFSIIKSTDLLTWSSVASPDFSGSIASLAEVWAPEWFVDSGGTVHITFSGDVGGNHQIYETHATNAALSTWSAAVAITGTGFPTDMIDSFVYYEGSTYYLVYKKNDTQTCNIASSPSLTSGYTALVTSLGSGVNPCEGPTLLKMPDGTYRLYIENTGTMGIEMFTAPSIGGTYTLAGSVFPDEMIHGTVVMTSDLGAMRALLAGTGATLLPRNWRRGISAMFQSQNGDAFGMEQVSGTETGGQPALRLFTSSQGSAYIAFGKYTSASSFTEWGRFTSAGSFSTGNPIVSTVSTGTAPLTIASTTAVTNLNADLLDGVHAGNVSAGHAMCWKDATHMGYCSDAPNASGVCTCN